MSTTLQNNKLLIKLNRSHLLPGMFWLIRVKCLSNSYTVRLYDKTALSPKT